MGNMFPTGRGLGSAPLTAGAAARLVFSLAPSKHTLPLLPALLSMSALFPLVLPGRGQE